MTLDKVAVELKTVYEPSDEFRKQAAVASRAAYDEMYKKSVQDPDAFWRELASDLYFQKTWTADNCCEWNFDTDKGPVGIKWFAGSTTNISYNCLDRNISKGLGDKPALIWEGNSPEEHDAVTYNQLKAIVCRIANALKRQGIKRGDDVTLYMPMVVELPATMLACARIGAVHSVVFGGFSAEAVAGRILDSKPKCVVTATSCSRATKHLDFKTIIDEALTLAKEGGHDVKTCIVYQHAPVTDRSTVNMVEGRDLWFQDLVAAEPDECEAEWMDAEDPLFKLYTSGSTGTPKGVLHSTTGYMVGTYATVKYVFDIRPDDIYWCTADCGWITGHSYLTYGPLLNGTTSVVFEGVPTWPDCGRCWEIVDKHKITVFYTAPTAIRSLMGAGQGYVTKHSRKSLRLLGTVGEPINPAAWKWYYEVVGDSRCPIADTYWQTETGAHMLTNLPGAFAMKPGSASLPFFGVVPAVLDDKGNELEGECSGLLAMKQPWPSIMRTVAGDHARFERTYFGHFKGYYFTGDGCKRDADGYYWITGRVDDVVNVSGHRMGTAEVESALVRHPQVSEAAVVPMEHDIKGQAIYAFVTLMEGNEYPGSAELRKELVAEVRKHIGPIASPDVIHWAPGLPKTRSGKIMRRILRKIANKEEDQLGDISTLADPSVVAKLIELRGQ
eukprot:CAMPEP_0117657814 /NCGR_PEP_ID=MMETSP0804-20121206/5530_1 /TAXON_ID=1074897 /ORGANISM="Tetraselmis astigmatica, Strain CCMP880" /LENGTH=668 /DNA_ID=CAMNT_0005464291 /DNA_START=93 /DNA_END=2099 /DNA_ORIENTATION=-